MQEVRQSTPGLARQCLHGGAVPHSRLRHPAALGQGVLQVVDGVPQSVDVEVLGCAGDDPDGASHAGQGDQHPRDPLLQHVHSRPTAHHEVSGGIIDPRSRGRLSQLEDHQRQQARPPVPDSTHGLPAVRLRSSFLVDTLPIDLVPLYYDDEKIVPPLDFTNPEAWSKKHMFFPLFDKEKGELPYPTHNKRVTWAMNSAVWILSKVTHIFRRSAAQILADKNCDLDTIAQLGQWDMNEMRRSYVTGIPRPAIQLQAGFSAEPGDYYIGRSKTEVPAKVMKDIEEHIFPKEEQWLIEAMEWNNEYDKEHVYYTAKSFLEALQAAQLPIAEDLAMYYVHCDDHPFDGVSVCECERHPYTQMSGLCKNEDFQKWALDVYLLDKYGIEMWTNPTMSRASDVSSQLGKKHLITQLRAEINFHKEGGKREIRINHLEKQVESLEREKRSMQSELEAKTEVLTQLQKAFDALKNTAATSAAANVGESERVP
ncbi:unnamed protein product [Closterium sp. Yama58-4]|nr:unnamed protein product [Closterium sp. Yama58-4]